MQVDNWNWAGNVGSRSGADAPRAKMLATAVRHVESVGLSLGINAKLVDRLAAEAGLSPKQFSQLWPSHEAFLADLFIELANQAQIDRADTETLLTTWQYLSMRVSDLRSPEGRRSVLIDIIRTAAEYNFDVVTASSKWRTYAALSTTISAWPEGAARSQVLEALRASEMSFVETMENFYRNVLPTVGYRLKPMFHNDYQPFVVAAASVIEGLGIVRATVPPLVEAHFTRKIEREGAVDEESWSVAALSFMGVVDAFIEPDPEFDADEAIARLSGGVDVTPPASDDEAF